MAQKHLKELLKEDQEPFYLKDYIANKQCLLKNKQQQQQQQIQKLQLKKPTSILPKNTSFFSLQDSPDLRKSPKLFNFPPSPIPNPKSPKKVFLHVPTKTATLLLEAAMRIQKQKSNPKTTHQIKNSGFGLFSTMLKKLSLRNRTQKLKSSSESDPTTKANNLDGEKVVASIISCSVSSSSSSSCNGRSSSLDLESSISGRSFDDEEDEEFEFTNVLKENNNNNINSNNNNNNGDYYYSPICFSPLSPFRFSLHKSPTSPGRCSPAKSPVRCKFQDIVNYEHENIMKFQEEDEEDKEQNSPVSVLDPPFEDDYDGHEDDSYENECSYAFVHRAQQELLHKLDRFEKLAELDPIELEKRLIEEKEYEVAHKNELEEYDDHETLAFDLKTEAYDLMQEVIRKTGFEDVKKPGMKRLISDLIMEEKSEEESSDEKVIKRICKRLESWKQVESNTIDMMVEIDLNKEINDWKKSRKEIDEAAGDIEVAIFAELVDELVEDLA